MRTRNFKFKIDIDGEWIPMTLESFHEAISQGNSLVHNHKRQYSVLTRI
jgi:hypothetical protein